MHRTRPSALPRKRAGVVLSLLGLSLIVLLLLPAVDASQVFTELGTPPRTLPPVQATWNYVIGASDLLNRGATPSGQVVSLDVYGVSRATITRLRKAGKYVICYYSAGASESYKTDPQSVKLLAPALNLGEVKRGENAVWPGDRWLDLRGFTDKPGDSPAGRRAAVIRGVMEWRLNLARQKGCQAVEPDVVDAWSNVVNQQAPAGTPPHAVSAADQLAYNRWTARAAHARGLSVLLKNDLEQIPLLAPYYDGALDESCFDYEHDCERLLPFRRMNKAIYVVVYHESDFATLGRRMKANRFHLNVTATNPEVTRLEPYTRFGQW